MPSRSRLYALEPIGIGTPETESLTGYVSRLTEAHSVRVRDLVVGELVTFLGRPHLANGRNANLLTAFWRNETRALNGTRSLARKMVRGLESLTGRLLCGQLDSNTPFAGSSGSGDHHVDRPQTRHTPIDPLAVHHALEAVLTSDEVPPPSLREVADRLGQTYANLRHYLPELSRATAARHRSYLEAQGERTRARVCNQVRQAAITLTHQGDYPSTNRIATLLGDHSVMRTLTARLAWHEALHELGWRT